MLYPNLSVNAAGHLMFAACDTVELAARYGTPLLLMDEALVRARCRTYKAAMARYFPAGSMPLYASKALCCKQMYRIMLQEDMGVDVVSSGELYTAVQAGFPLERAYFHGNNKTDGDIALAMEHGIGFFVCDNAEELHAIEAEAARRGIIQKILLRLAPGIDPHTHEKINTGRVDSKFGVGVETGQAEALTALTLAQPHIQLEGFHCHVGSQLFDITPLIDAVEAMTAYIAHIRDTLGYEARVLNLGGGMGVRYVESDPVMDYADGIRRIAAAFDRCCVRYGLTPPVVLMEPGRSIVADAGLTLYTVGGTKCIPGFKNYVSIDGGMTDNPRYTLYQSDYTVLPADRMGAGADGAYTVAGRCCESGDLIQEKVPLPHLERGALLAVCTTGAYNYSMASNYNRIPRPPVVFLGEDGPCLAVRRESLADLLACDM